ncbi:RDD family protein [Chitinophagaceae bacterium 26-R-25]|nr:RDD family protein [Chitinophagaceae bacterium 26-R-25]
MQIMEGVERRDIIFFLMLGQFIEILILFPALGLLQTSRKPCITNGDSAGLNIFEPVNKSKRLLHLVIDVLFVSFVAYTFLRSVEKTFIVNVYDRIILTSGLMAVFFGIYYLIMELFFKVTFAKIITNTVVVDKRGKKAGIFHIIGRSLCRFIPLEGVSFLFKDRGWHDMLSGTYVVNDQYSWEKQTDAFDTYFTGEPESETATSLIP